MDNEFIGAIKIKDGLFIGDEYAAQDLEFIVTNKISHIINCAGRQLADYWESLGVSYLTYNWLDSQSQIIFDQKGEVLNEVYNFITEAHANGDSVLIHSQRGQSRACCIIAGFFMKRFHWSLYKTLEFLASRRPDLEIRDSFYYQLVNLESKLQQSGINLSNNWNEVTPEMDTEELLMRNTFLNAKNAPLDECLVNLPDEIEDKAQTLLWGDHGTDDTNKLAVFLTDEHIMKLRLAPSKTLVKSILKGSNKIFRFGNNARDQENIRNEHKQASGQGMKMNRSLKTLHEEKPNLNNSHSSAMRKGAVPIGGTRTIDLNDTSSKNGKVPQPQTMARSSSASQFEKEGSDFKDTTSPLAPTSSNIIGGKGGLVNSNSAIGLGLGETEKNLAMKGTLNFSNGSTTLMKDQSNSLSQSSGGLDKYLPQGHKGKHQSLSMSGLEKKADTDVMIENLRTLTDSTGLSVSINDSFSKVLSNPSVDKNSLNYLASKHLKMAIEKKLSKDPRGNNSAIVPTVSDDTMTLPTEHNNTSTINTSITGKLQLSDFQSLERPPRDNRGQQIPKAKECPRPTDIKVNYQILLKNRETPPPRQREEAKKNPESVYKKALAKSSTGSIKSKENTIPTSTSYIQNVPSSLMQSGNLAPLTLSNSNIQNMDKRIPTSTKAAQSNFASTNAGRGSIGDKSQLSTLTSQNFEKNYASANPYMDSYLRTSAIPNASQVNQPYPFKTQVNNFMQQTKNVPVKATYEKIDRPLSSGASMRAGTPNTALSQNNKYGPIEPASKFDRKENIVTGLNVSHQPSSSLRSFSPGLKPGQGQQSRKESPSSQTNAKFRQRSSSPAQSLSYNNLVNVGSVLKPKWKF